MTWKQLFLALVFVSIIICCKKEENNPPQILSQSFEIQEKSPNGTVIGTVIASDPNNDELTYELKSNLELPFYIDTKTGYLIVKNGELIDYETESRYSVTVLVTEKNRGALFCSAEVTINVKNIDDMPLNGLIAYYPFNGDAKDVGKNSFNGIVYGATEFNNRKDAVNSALNFNGKSDYVKINSMVGNEIRSISLWFRLGASVDQNIGNVVPLLTRDGDPQNVAEFNFGFIPTGWVGNTGKLRFIYNYIKDDYYYVQSNDAVWAKDKWHHVVIVIDPSDGMKMFIDNILQNDIAKYYSGIASSGNNMSIYVGSFEPSVGRYLLGQIDDLIFYNRPLNISEIGELFRL